MANIYEQRTEELHTLLTRASAGGGATVVIPDLQRPFVWQPGQVVLLIDSLVRGWPFGTLLMWKVNHEDLRAIPHREFWQVVDRTANGDGAAVIRKDPPATYHMVLDGQQRLQSLLLALCGDGWGFKLDDRDWTEQLTGDRPRGRRPKHPHWSKGTLCFDTKAFLNEYHRGGDVTGVNYRNALVWAVTDPSDGQSKWDKPDNYKDPLPKVFAEDGGIGLVRLSRLWDAVPPNPSLKEKHFQDTLKSFLPNHGIAKDAVEELLRPMGELMSTLLDLKLSKVTFLELRQFDNTLWTEDEYNSAIVNIFTRLNTAGRTLTREEITFAWLKVGWDEKATGNKTAGVCFSELLQQVRDRGLKIQMDDLVRAVSFIWSVAYRDGELLLDQDLLKGDTVQPMAGDLAEAWADIVEAVLAVMDVVRARELQYGQSGQYYSMNSVSTLWAWYFLARRWLHENPLGVEALDTYEKSLTSYLHEHADRWLICSHWAGRWGSSSASVVGGYAKELHTDHSSLAKAATYNDALTILSERLARLVSELSNDAAAHVASFSVDRREQVSRYSTLLWVWHRLDETRWQMSRISLRTGRRQHGALEVDHTVAHARWERQVRALPPKDADEEQELMQTVNSLGNCTLLEKTFNISKSSQPIRQFLSEVHEFKSGQVDLDEWAEALKLPKCMLDAADGSVAEVRKAIEARDKEMRDELVQFVQGKIARRDL